MRRLLVVLAISVLVAFAPAGLAHAQLGGPQVPTPLTEPPPPPPTIDNELEDEGLSGLQQAMIFAGAALVLALIGFAILRDAKRAAPADDRRARNAGGGGDTGRTTKKAKGAPGMPATAVDTSASALRARERQRAKRAKAKAKAARNQRKRNRPK
jgi:hypothetical protein